MEINKSLNSKERDIFKLGKVNWKELKIYIRMEEVSCNVKLN